MKITRKPASLSFTDEEMLQLQEQFSKIPEIETISEGPKPWSTLFLRAVKFCADNQDLLAEKESLTAQLAEAQQKITELENSLPAEIEELTLQKNQVEESLRLSTQVYQEKQILVDQLETQVSTLTKTVDEWKQKFTEMEESFQLQENQVLLDVDPNLLQTVRKLLPDFIQRGYIRKGDSPSVFFNKSAWEFLRIFYGIAVEPKKIVQENTSAANPTTQNEQQ